MIKYLQKALGKIADFENKHFLVVLLFILLLTGGAVVGIMRVRIESDFAKFDPEGIPALDLANKIGKQFSRFSSILIIVELDEESGIGEGVTDIRDPKVIEFLVELQENLNEEQKIQGVRSAGLFFQQGVPEDIETVKGILSQIPESENFFNKKYSLTPVIIDVDVGADNVKVNAMNARVKEILDSSGKPGGIKTTVTGEPALMTKIFEFILQDGLFTLIAAAITIFVLLLIIKRSLKYSFVVIIPVLFGIAWTVGAMGWFEIPITVATAAIGAMLLGLGTEYSVFLSSRYLEEKETLSQPEALKKALSTTGASTVSSGITTMIGFFALTLSIFPMLSDLGFVLGLGILFVLASTMFTGPLVMIIEEKIVKNNKKKKKHFESEKKESRTSRLFEKYGSIVSRHPIVVIVLALVVTVVLFGGITLLKNEEIDFENTLPQDLPELVAFRTMENEFGDTTGVKIHVELDPSYTGSNEPTDVRDPRVVRYVDLLSNKAKQLEGVVRVGSISESVKQLNAGILPGSLAEQKRILDLTNYRHYITEDFSATIVRIDLDEDATRDSGEVVRQLYEITHTTAKPAGVSATPSGGIIVNYEMNKIINPDSGKTALIAFVVIVVFLFLISRSIKYTILPLVTVIAAVIWTLGLIGFFQVPFNSIISSVISMTIGIGIDFGIQLSMRFRQELATGKEKRRAMCETLKYTLYPMVITVIAALVGFRAMTFGQLTLMGDLGEVLSFGVTSSMIIAVSLVAGLMIVFERKKKHLKNPKLSKMQR